MNNSKILTVVLKFHQYKTKTYFNFPETEDGRASFKSLFPPGRTEATALSHAFQERMWRSISFFYPKSGNPFKFGHQNYHFSRENLDFNSQMFQHFFFLILFLIFFGYYRHCQSCRDRGCCSAEAWLYRHCICWKWKKKQCLLKPH